MAFLKLPSLGGGESHCLLDFIEAKGEGYPPYVIFSPKNCVKALNKGWAGPEMKVFGWAVHFSHETQVICLADVITTDLRKAEESKLKPRKRGKYGLSVFADDGPKGDLIDTVDSDCDTILGGEDEDHYEQLRNARVTQNSAKADLLIAEVNKG